MEIYGISVNTNSCLVVEQAYFLARAQLELLKLSLIQGKPTYWPSFIKTYELTLGSSLIFTYYKPNIRRG